MFKHVHTLIGTRYRSAEIKACVIELLINNVGLGSAFSIWHFLKKKLCFWLYSTGLSSISISKYMHIQYPVLVSVPSPYVIFPLVSIVSWLIMFTCVLLSSLSSMCINMPSISLVLCMVLSLHAMCKVVKYVVSHHLWILSLCCILLIKC